MSSSRPLFSSLKAVLATLAITCLFIPTGCQTIGPDKGQAITQLSSELEESNQRLEEMYHRLSVVQFMVDTHERTIADLERQLRQSGFLQGASAPGSDVTSTPLLIDINRKKKEAELLAQDSTPPSVEEETLKSGGDEQASAETLYNKGFAALKEKNYTRAISLFKKVVSQYPDHNLADNAIYWTGEIHYTQHNYEEAIQTFKRLTETYPEGGKVPDALLKIGYSYHSLGDTENAIKYLKQVVVDYPFTVPGSKAEAMLNRIE